MLLTLIVMQVLEPCWIALMTPKPRSIFKYFYFVFISQFLRGTFFGFNEKTEFSKFSKSFDLNFYFIILNEKIISPNTSHYY